MYNIQKSKTKDFLTKWHSESVISLHKIVFQHKELQILLFLCFIANLSKAQSPCTGGSITFEKTSGYSLENPQAQEQVLTAQAGQAVLPDCIELCKNSAECHVFNIDYNAGMCTSITMKETIREQIRINPLSSVFEKICLDGVENYERLCDNRMWAFERVVGASMTGFRDREETNVLNRAVCERLCLLESYFVCRSAQYDSATRTCILSREDRRTQPSAFLHSGGTVDYLENQCVTPPIANCVYESRQHFSAVSIEDINASSSEDECQSFCDHSRLFFCRSYTYIPNQRICYLSGDDTVSFSNTVPRTSAVYGERKCTGNQCTDGIVTFEKVTSYELQNARQEILLQGALGNTAKCLSLCKEAGDTCPAILVNYATSACYRLDRNSKYRERDLIPAPIGGINLFEPVCLRGNTQSCANKLWAIERVPNYELRGFDDKVLPYVQSLRECEEACIREQEFQCLSAEYDYDRILCTLSSENRRSQRPYFVSTIRKVDYLENQCIHDSDASCKHVFVAEAIPRYVDVIKSNIETVEECQEACNHDITFICRSFGYRTTTKECLLSGDDQISGGKISVVPSSGISYYERVCGTSSNINNDTTIEDQQTSTTMSYSVAPTMSYSVAPTMSYSVAPTMSTTVTLPFPFTPPTQEPFTHPTTMPIPSTAGRCTDDTGRTEFEKTTGYKVANELSLLHDGGNILGITYECTVKCNADESCQGFVLDYVNNKCYSLKNDPQLNVESLQRAQSTSYFEPLCYRLATGCGKLWTFERFPQKQLNVVASATFKGVTKSICQERCLVETRFLCRSLNYDATRQECHLNIDDRFTRPAAIDDSTSFDYIENQCYQYSFLNTGHSFPKNDNYPRMPGKYPVPDYGVHPRKSQSRDGGQFEPRNNCRFAIEESNSLLIYIEKEKVTSSAVECQRICDTEILFNCRSFTYMINEASGYKNGHCYLSADTKDSPGAEMRTQVGASYVEKVCNENALPWPKPQELFPPQQNTQPPFYQHPSFSVYPVYPSPVSPPSQSGIYPHPYPMPYPVHNMPITPGYTYPFTPQNSNTELLNPSLNPKEPINYLGSGGQTDVFPIPGTSNSGTSKCFSDEDLTFERITHLAGQGVGSEVRISILLSPTLDCIRECVAFGDQCQSLTFRTSFTSYIPPCTVHGAPAGSTTTLPITSSDAAYFQKICITGQKCGKVWTFDRVPFYVLEGHDDLELRNINSREECASACLQQTAFPCRSAEYYYSQTLCRLSRETRRTQSVAYRYYGDGVEYLENQCNPEPGFCGFYDFPNKFLPYFDRRLLGVVNLFECKAACGREAGFTCHSVAYDEQSRECFLSSCDRFCGYGTVERPFVIYSERQACDSQLASQTLFRYQTPYQQQPYEYAEATSLTTTRSNSFTTCDLPRKVGFERTTGYAPLSVYQEIIPTSHVRGITEECVTKCFEMGSRCQAFVLMYLPPPSIPECVVYTQMSYTETTLSSEQAHNKPDVAYFEKLCLGGPSCEKLWTFERMFGYEISAGFSSFLQAVETRHECEDLCLKHVQFLCRSAVYSIQTRTCRLNAESRHTRPMDFRFVGGDVQYLENQCIISVN